MEFKFQAHYFFTRRLKPKKENHQSGTFSVVKQGEVSKKGFYILRTVQIVKCIIFTFTCSVLVLLVTSYLWQLQDSTSVLSYKNCFKWSQNMTFTTVQTVCSTFLSHDGMILGNVGISPRPSSCLTRNNAQRRFGFDRISSIAQRCDLPVISPFDLRKVRKSRKQIMLSQILPKKKREKKQIKIFVFWKN